MIDYILVGVFCLDNFGEVLVDLGEVNLSDGELNLLVDRDVRVYPCVVNCDNGLLTNFLKGISVYLR